jgi:hypothetical protein
VTQAMIFWLLFLCCALSAWLIGYGMGYLRGVREAITGDAFRKRNQSGGYRSRLSPRRLPRLGNHKMWNRQPRSLFK